MLALACFTLYAVVACVASVHPQSIGVDANTTFRPLGVSSLLTVVAIASLVAFAVAWRMPERNEHHTGFSINSDLTRGSSNQ